MSPAKEETVGVLGVTTQTISRASRPAQTTFCLKNIALR